MGERSRPAARRRGPALGLALAVAAGLGIRVVAAGPVAKLGGDLFYATAADALLVLGWPRTRPAVTAGVAVAFCWAVELFQLTPVPAAVSARSLIGRLVLGSTFGWPDLAVYPFGVLLALVVQLASRARSAGLREQGFGHRLG